MRIGIGYDIHPLVDERKLILGGLEIPYIKGLKGYSDADVLLHAIGDAILGAIAKGDLGRHFPDTEAAYEGIPSREIIKRIMEMAQKEGFSILNIDTTIICEEPKLEAFKERMQKNIAAMLNVSPTQINIKAGTQEGIGPVGKGEAIAAYAVALLDKNKSV